MKVIIIGNGVAGITAAKTVREQSPDAAIDVFTDEQYHYYFRPKLIAFLAGLCELNDLYAYPAAWYEKQKINVHFGATIKKFDPAEKTITTTNGSLSFDKLLVANGSSPFLPPIPGINREGIFTLRTINDARVIQDYARKVKKAVVMGGGLLGLESAWALQKIGVTVTVLEYFTRLLPRQLDKEGAQVLLDRINALGIEVKLSCSTEEFLGDKKISGVRTKDGELIEADLALVSAGVKPNLQLASQAELKINKGVVVDGMLKSSRDDIYAAGDIAEFNGLIYGIIPPAIEQAKTAAANMIGDKPAAYNGTTPTTTLKVMGIDLSCMGISNPETGNFELLKKEDKEKGIYKKLVLQENRLVGAIWLGVSKGALALNGLVAKKTDVSRYKDELLNHDFDFKKIGTTNSQE